MGKNSSPMTELIMKQFSHRKLAELAEKDCKNETAKYIKELVHDNIYKSIEKVIKDAVEEYKKSPAFKLAVQKAVIESLNSKDIKYRMKDYIDDAVTNTMDTIEDDDWAKMFGNILLNGKRKPPKKKRR